MLQRVNAQGEAISYIRMSSGTLVAVVGEVVPGPLGQGRVLVHKTGASYVVTQQPDNAVVVVGRAK